MPAIASRARAKAPRATPVALLVGLLVAGCSALLADDATQCSQDRDCSSFGPSSVCNLATKVCVTGGGGAGQAGTAGSSAGSTSGGDAGMPDAGSSQGGSAEVAGASGSVGMAGMGNVAGTGNAAGTGGTGGTVSTGGTGGSGGEAPIPGWDVLAPLSSGVRLRVRSFCSKSLWLRVTNTSGVTLTPSPSGAELGTGMVKNYDAPGEWKEGRITAFGAGPQTGEVEKVDVSVTNGLTYYTVQYLDALGLPVEAVGFGGACAAQKVEGCKARQRDTATCPETFLSDGYRCLSARTYCLVPANQGNPYCHALDSAITSCAACPGGTTVDAYAGIGPYGGEARLAAALNRGMTADPDNKDASQFYKKTPHNTYARWARGLCPDTLAFPHDDYGAPVPYKNCDAKELRVTFCPAR